eukprot:TRINITY_DN22967_c0_g1_i5.p1 TRINITY_DN22967_c0_g1~~TRINITY_DN22967_c0_g1_i5.p1  ORF type:complete len:361 (+),score=32.61 TRINITY_DN22967_c0_g1_i5:279-1361(+)
MSPGCGYLDFGPSPITECGPACTFHGGQGGVDVTTTSWGGSVNLNEKDGKYWMFAAEMSEHCTLSHWTTNSQVVSAVSDTPVGPFVRQAVAVPPWSHNPQAVIAPDGTWVIFTLGPGFGQKPQVNCSQPTVEPADLDHSDIQGVNFTVHYAASPRGPWTPLTFTPSGWDSNWTLQNPGNWNPAPVFGEDGSIRIMAHTDWNPWAGEVILEAPSWRGPYRVHSHMGDRIDRCDFCEEDPFMWRDKRGNWHVLYHRMFDPYGPLDPNWGSVVKPTKTPVPLGWAGGHAFSKDGYVWSNWTRCYNTSVVLTNGTVVEHQRRERPKLLFDADKNPTHLYNGVFDTSGSSVTFTIVAPIKGTHAD